MVVVALLVMVVITILGLAFLGSSLTESQIGSNESDLRKAFFAAEAGIQEAMYRMRLDPGSFPTSIEGTPACSTTADPVVIGQQGTPAFSWANPGDANFWKYNPPTCSWTYSGENATGYGNYFGGSPANLNGAGRTFTSSGSVHALGGQLVNADITNTASDPRSYTVTVAPVVGYVGGCWQYVDQFGTPLPGSACGLLPSPFNPLLKVTSTGTAKSSQKVLSTMIRRSNINPNPDGTITANTNIDIKSAATVVDGRNYDCNGNPDNSIPGKSAATAPTGVTAPCPPGSPTNICINKPENLQCTAGTGVGSCGGPSQPFPDTIGELLLGHPYKNDTPPPTQAKLAQIDALNAYLASIKVSPAAAPDKNGSPFHGIVYVDGNYPMPPPNSSGILIVHHRDAYGQNGCTNAGGCDVANLGNFNGGTFKGLIIADSLDKTNGNATIIGAIFGFGAKADGIKIDDVAGTPDIKFSQCILDGLNQYFPFQIVQGTWHEQ